MSKTTNILTVERYIFKEDWTIGRLYFKDKIIGYTVEDEIRDVKVHGETAIPEGTYPLGLRLSPRFSKHFKFSLPKNVLVDSRLIHKYDQATYQFVDHALIWIQDVPNFKYILLHWGNTDDDTDGCLIVGNRIGIVKGKEAVLSSRLTYARIYPKIREEILKGNTTITYKNLK